jgi:cobalamin-dependent methionine synthase I
MIVIGEKINASFPEVKNIIQERDGKKLLDFARKQVTAGSDFIDLNVGTGVGSREDEILSMEWAIDTVQN